MYWKLGGHENMIVLLSICSLQMTFNKALAQTIHYADHTKLRTTLKLIYYGIAPSLVRLHPVLGLLGDNLISCYQILRSI